ncbi:GNAT family N-acetyltransferase [Brachybacterium sp. J144]|uniref:GNAT family N-acetyltransferase n=1 Tax=Brachybacterium sp. J144 TaxID=3116487 RepID=UPI002E766A21|nr:GNAT family N-acetyltransferase [Brachybacterium sp. J144]MEE1651153.1 GNAT family N-acetyltransferase [Brachybacterium sp. J144]
MTDESGASHWETDTLARREQNWRRWLEGGSAVTVAETVAEPVGEESGAIIGFAMTGDARTVGEHAPARERELFSIYVLAAHHGGGAGQALLEAALPAGTPAQLWVAEQNPRARRFYARNGFAPDGVQVLDAVLDLEELRLVR